MLGALRHHRHLDGEDRPAARVRGLACPRVYQNGGVRLRAGLFSPPGPRRRKKAPALHQRFLDRRSSLPLHNSWAGWLWQRGLDCGEISPLQAVGVSPPTGAPPMLRGSGMTSPALWRQGRLSLTRLEILDRLHLQRAAHAVLQGRALYIPSSSSYTILRKRRKKMRLAAQAKGGFYPTPDRVVDMIADLIGTPIRILLPQPGDAAHS